MSIGALSSLAEALQFATAWRSPPSGASRSEVSIQGANVPSPITGTVVRPEGSPGPGWVVLHGMTRLGRAHPELQRFVRALAATGAGIFVPEIREWIELEFAPQRAQAITTAAVDWLHEQPWILPGGVMLVGFSFGAPQALSVAAHPLVRLKLRGVVGWGGYADIERTFRFSLTGEHEWEGIVYRQRPDPYARWVIGKNCIPLSPSLSGHIAVASALSHLAVEAGERRIQSWDPAFDPLKRALRDGLPRADRPLFDLFAPPANREPDRDGAEAVVRELVPVIRQEIPLLEPVRGIDEITPAVRLLHGRSDHLIPFTETLRLGRALEQKAPNLSTRLTGLFNHSGDSVEGTWWNRARENVRLIGSLKGIFEVSRA